MVNWELSSLVYSFSLSSLPVDNLCLPELENLNLLLSTVTRWEIVGEHTFPTLMHLMRRIPYANVHLKTLM